MVAACFGTRPRRLIFVGGLTLLGWLGLALASAATASADSSGHGQPRAVVHVDRLLAPVTTALSGKHTAHSAHSARPAHSAQSAQRAHPVRPAHSAPLLGGVVPAVTKVVSRATTPVVGPLLGTDTSAGAPTATAPEPRPAPVPQPSSEPITADLQAIADAVRATTNLTLQVPLVGLTIHLGLTDPAVAPAPIVSPPGNLHAVTVKAPAPTRPHRAAVRPAPSRPDTAADRDSRSAAQSLPLARPTGTTRGAFVDGGPTRMPPALPAVPGVAVASASGSASASRPGSGAGIYSARTSETWAAQHLRLLGTTEWTRTRDVRNSATKPPVAPD